MKFIVSRLLVLAGCFTMTCFLIASTASRHWVREEAVIKEYSTSKYSGLWITCWQKCLTHEEYNEEIEKLYNLVSSFNVKIVLWPYLLQTRGLMLSAILLSILCFVFTGLGIRRRDDLMFKKFVLIFMISLVGLLTMSALILFGVQKVTVKDADEKFKRKVDMKEASWKYEWGYEVGWGVVLFCIATVFAALFENKSVRFWKSSTAKSEMTTPA